MIGKIVLFGFFLIILYIIFKRFNFNLITIKEYFNIWIILGLLISWIGIIGLFIQSDLELIKDGWIKTILEYKIFFVNIFWFSIGLFSFAIIIKSVYYDAILLVLNIVSNPIPEIIDKNILNYLNIMCLLLVIV